MIQTLIFGLVLSMGIQAMNGDRENTVDEDKRWLALDGDVQIEPGRGRRIVFMAGDEEYRSE